MIYGTDYHVIKKISLGGGFLSEYIDETWEPRHRQFCPDTTCIFAHAYPYRLEDGKRIVDKLNIEYGYGRDRWDIDSGRFVDWVLIHIKIDYDVVWDRESLIKSLT